jgi:hypothetical protein
MVGKTAEETNSPAAPQRPNGGAQPCALFDLVAGRRTEVAARSAMPRVDRPVALGASVRNPKFAVCTARRSPFVGSCQPIEARGGFACPTLCLQNGGIGTRQLGVNREVDKARRDDLTRNVDH